MIKIGQKIENISFEIFQGNKIKKVSLGDFLGKYLVLAFYPADFTFVCPTELEELAKFYPQFKKENAEIISVSVDTAFVHKAWHNSSEAIKKVDYGMAADPTRALCNYFGTIIDEEGLSLRATFIIDPEGVIKSIEMHDNSIGRSTKEILRKLQAIKFVKEHKGLVCPASWEPGGETLKP